MPVLSTIEKKVLVALSKLNRKADAEAIAEEAGIRVDQVLATIESLRVKKLIEVEEVIHKYFRVTDEGSRYVTLRLPEARLLQELLKIKRVSTKELPRIITSLTKQELNIALNWARRKKWISLEKIDNITYVSPLINSIPARTKLEELLLFIKENKEVSENEISTELRDAIDEAVERKLVNIREEKEWILSLTEKGLDLTKKIEVVRETIARLNHELIITGKWKSVEFKPYNIEAMPPMVYPGKKHPYTVFLEEIRKILISMGFVEAKGPLVEAEFWNFDVLFQPQDHVAREIHDSFIVKKPQTANVSLTPLVERVKETHEKGWITGSTGWNYKWNFQIARRLILRSQTTSVSARTLARGVPIPYKMFSIDKVFRPDVIDRTHSIEFMQCEGIVVGEGLNLKHLLGYLKQFAIELGFEKIKFKPSYFPFTEPSVEAFLYHPKLGWFEALGAGLFRPEVLLPLGIDYPRIQVLAWGIGIDRLAMLKLGIDDIRYLHSQDLQWLREKSLRW
ncbi:MAG: phenylalanine--tRNA ligase subunit alpha [Candidatus Asgardarchaeia archaeon]